MGIFLFGVLGECLSHLYARVSPRFMTLRCLQIPFRILFSHMFVDKSNNVAHNLTKMFSFWILFWQKYLT